MLLAPQVQAARTERLDHLGLIAAICFEIDLAGRIDEIVGPTRRAVSVGQAVQAMVINGLGFVGRPLYLAPEFFANKPVDKLIGRGITADMLNDDSLGDALDRLAEAGMTQLFAAVASHSLEHFGIETGVGHLDSTSFSFEGQYPADGGDDLCRVRVTHGYSKEKRADLKQLVVNIITAHKSRIPLWFWPLSGNSSDKASFPETVDWFCESLAAAKRPLLIVDSALYSRDALARLDSASRFITRVPATIAEVRRLIEESVLEQMTLCADPRYRIRQVTSEYGGVAQRWVVVHSEAAFESASKTVQTKAGKELDSARAQAERLCGKRFETVQALNDALDGLAAKWGYHRVASHTVERHEGYHRRGRPARDAVPDRIEFSASSIEIARDDEKCAAALARSGWFVLATNELDETVLDAEAVLMEYKGQASSVESGFRFLKSPEFFASPMNLKTPLRIQAMLMVMTLCLLVYSLAEHRMQQRQSETREELVDARLPSGNNKKVSLRRVFQVFEGVDLLRFKLGPDTVHEQVLNLHDIHRRVLRLFGAEAEKIYALP